MIRARAICDLTSRSSRAVLAGMIFLLLAAQSGLADQQPPPADVDLGIDNKIQETRVWCWAAVIQQVVSALSGHDALPSQCELVAMSRNFPADRCCTAAGTWNGNRDCRFPATIPEMSRLIDKFAMRVEAFGAPEGPLALYEVLATRRAVLVAVRRRGFTWLDHIVVVTGMSWRQTEYGLAPFVHINDPVRRVATTISFRRLSLNWKHALIVG